MPSYQDRNREYQPYATTNNGRNYSVGNRFIAFLGTLYDDKEAEARIDEYCRVARVLHGLKNAHFGHIGHSLNSMLDMNFDPTMITVWFGCHVKHCEANQIVTCYEKASDQEIEADKAKILEFFDTPDPVSDPVSIKLSDGDLYTAARVYVALDNFVADQKLNGLTYYYDGAESSLERLVMTNLIVGNSLLTSKNIPMCGESDMKTLVALFIMDRFGMGGSFAELHPVDFSGDFVLVGHDGPHNISIAEGKPVIRSLKSTMGSRVPGQELNLKSKQALLHCLASIPLSMESSSLSLPKANRAMARYHPQATPIPGAGLNLM